MEFGRSRRNTLGALMESDKVVQQMSMADHGAQQLEPIREATRVATL